MFVKMMKKLVFFREIINYFYFTQLGSILRYGLKSTLKLNSRKIKSFLLSLKDCGVGMFCLSRQLLFSSLALYAFQILFGPTCFHSLYKFCVKESYLATSSTKSGFLAYVIIAKFIKSLGVKSTSPPSIMISSINYQNIL